MNTWEIHLGFLMISAMTTLMLLGLAMTIFMPGMDRWSRRFFHALFSMQLLCCGSCIIDFILYRHSDASFSNQKIWFFESLLISIPLLMFAHYLPHCCGKPIRKSGLVWGAHILWILFFSLLVIAQLTPWFFRITSDSRYVRGPLYFVGAAPLIGLLLLNLTHVILWRDRLARRYFIAFLLHLLPLTVALVVHTFVFRPLVLEIGMTISMLAMFAIIMLDQVEQYLRQQREIVRQRANVTVLQMRPHFIYNTMTTIYYLCEQDPRKAQQVILNFTTYLRKNFYAIASENTIPFSEELEHTRAYLAVEQAQFEDALFITFDTPHTQFRLPPLTLQPIVENAIKHGMDPDAGPLHIVIRTRETDAGSVIIVEDDGAGTDRTSNDDPHIALSNIRQRLRLMSGGKLEISPREGGGTIVTVTIAGSDRTV